MWLAPEVRDNVFIGAFLIAFAFYSMRGSETNTLISVIIIGGVLWVGYTYLQGQSARLEKTASNIEGALDDEAKWQQGRVLEAHSNAVTMSPFPKKGFKYLKMNPILVEIAKDVSIIRMFDRARYGDLCHLLNTYQKTYMYILSDRYDATQYLSVFQDLGDAVLENMYSYIFVLPPKLKHVYGVDPDALLQDNIKRFTVLRRKMSSILANYAKKERGVHVVPDALPSANGTCRYP